MTTGKEQPLAGEPATVLANLTNAMFRLQLACGREVVAHAAQDLRMAFTRLLPGDRVLVEVSPFDPNKARICRRLATTQQPTTTHPHSKP
jgi:translation initiation factor IF-1